MHDKFMKKNRQGEYSLPVKWKKTCLVMKLTCILTLLLSITVSASVFSQQEVVTLNVKSTTLSKVLMLIKDQTGVKILYNESALKNVECKEVTLRNVMVEDALKRVLRNTGFWYTMVDGVFVVKEIVGEPEKENFQISGLVTDVYKAPLPGVTVLVKGGNIALGTATSTDGRYKLTIPGVLKQFSISFSFVGMETKVVEYVGRDTINVVLKEDAKKMDEVVVTGYQTIKKRASAGSTSSVKAEELVLNGTQTLEQALQGKIPGMMVMSRSGLTGTRQRVRVRGTSTLLGNAEPVWVVDGVIQEDPLPFKSNDLTNLDPSNMDMIRDFVGGAIAWLNPNDIETVTVLKDAASTAIYGVKAANGVIVITTKKGQVGRMAVSYSGNFSLSPRMTYNKLELMNSKQRVEVSREAYQTGIPLSGNQNIGYTALAKAYKNREITLEEFSEGAKQLERNNTDWFKILFRNAFSHNHNVSISGGSNRATYRASFGYLDNYNTAKGNEQEQYTANINVTANLWENISITTSLAGSVQKTKGYIKTDPFEYASTVNRAIAAYTPDGNRFYYEDESNGFLYNIENELEHSGNENTQSSLKLGFGLRWKIFEGLMFNTSLSYGYSSTQGEAWIGEQTNYMAFMRGYNYEEYDVGSDKYATSQIPHGGEYTESQNTNVNWSWRNQLEYMNVFNGVHSVSLMIGQEARGVHSTGSALTAYGYLRDRGKIFVNLPPTQSNYYPIRVNNLLRTIPELTDTESNSLSYYLTAGYMFDNRYAFNFSVRTDASNRFGQDKSTRFQPVWSVGIRWNVGSEHWLEGSDLLSDMSLRVSYGFQGNVIEGVSPDLIATIETSTTDYDYNLKLKDLPAPELKWEKVSNLNLGADFSFFGNKINGTFEYYYKKTKDMVIDVEVPYENGVTSRKMNGGKMSNRGWDISVGFVPVRTKDFVVSLQLNTGKTYNKIRSSIEPTGSWQEATTGNLNKEGYPVSSFWAFRFTGLSPEHGGPLFDFSGRETEEALTDATVYLNPVGKLEPDFTGGLSLSIRYKTWALTSGLYLSTGNQSFLASPTNGVIESIPSEYRNMSKEWLKRWRNPGDEKYTKVPSLPNVSSSAKEVVITLPARDKAIVFQPYECYAYSDARVVDAWYIRCNNISLSYTVPADKLPSLFQNLSFQCSVSNPFQIRSKDFMGRDPEVALGRQPLQRSVSFSVNMSF